MSSSIRRGLARSIRYGAIFGGGGIIMGVAGLNLYTRNAQFVDISPETDAIFQHPFLRLVNPRNNPTSHDCCTIEVSYADIKPELIADALAGGSTLVENFAAGVWGGYPFNPQRIIMGMARRNDSNASDLWNRDQLLQSKYPEGTIVADDFQVVSRGTTHIIFRGGLSPRYKKDSPREFDTLVALEADLDGEKQSVRFKLKTIVLDGLSNGAAPPMGALLDQLHGQYAKALIKSGMYNCSV